MEHADSFASLKKSILALKASLQKSKVVNINSIELRAKFREMVQSYFRTVRPSLEKMGCSMEQINQLDFVAQSLLRLSNGKNPRKSYLNLIAEATKNLNSLEIQREMLLGHQNLNENSTSNLNSEEKQIIETLTKMLPSAALSYQQALRDLKDVNRMSFRGTANELRECLRELLDKLAPDETLMANKDFHLEKGQVKPNQKQKVRFILRSRSLPLNAIKVPEDTLSFVEEAIASLTRSIYERSSISAHVTTTKSEVLKIKGYIDKILIELLILN